jgi:hypothetical protein
VITERRAGSALVVSFSPLSSSLHSILVMAYRGPYQDPYIAQHRQSRDNSPQRPFDKPQEFNPYVDKYQPLGPPDQGDTQGYGYRGYQDEPAIPGPGYSAIADVSQPGGDVDTAPPAKVKEERLVDGNIMHPLDRIIDGERWSSRTVRALKRYRYDVQGNLWRKASIF